MFLCYILCPFFNFSTFTPTSHHNDSIYFVGTKNFAFTTHWIDTIELHIYFVVGYSVQIFWDIFQNIRGWNFAGVLEGSSQQQRRMKNDKSRTLKSIGEKYFFLIKPQAFAPAYFSNRFLPLFCDELACDPNKSRSQFGRRRRKIAVVCSISVYIKLLAHV